MLPEHREWLGDLYARGVFVLSGRLVPPTGGFMLARGVERKELEEILAGDPFRRDGLLTHSVIELSVTRCSPELAGIAEGK